MDMGLIAGMTASVIARNVFHCWDVSGSSAGSGGSGVAFGDTGSVDRVEDILPLKFEYPGIALMSRVVAPKKGLVKWSSWAC
jgi:hypothetical protein